MSSPYSKALETNQTHTVPGHGMVFVPTQDGSKGVELKPGFALPHDENVGGMNRPELPASPAFFVCCAYVDTPCS